MATGYGELPVVRVARRLGRWGDALYRFREEAAFARAALLVLGFAAVTGISAQLAIPLPFTPVPVTGQVFAVLLSAALLGRKLGPLSQMAYVGLGFVGVPWFAATTGGPIFSVGGAAVVLGATGGYLLGFIPAAAVIGALIDRRRSRADFSGTLLVLFAGVATVYALGAAQLALVLELPAAAALDLGVLPFVPGDMLKCLLVALTVAGSTPWAGAAPAERGPVTYSMLRPRDVAVFLAVVSVVWVLAAVITTAVPVPPLLAAWYLLAAAVCTAMASGSFALRIYLERRRGRPAPASTAAR